MKEKLYEIPIDKPLTPAKRKVIDQYIANNAHLAPVKLSHEWEDEADPVLKIKTPPVAWEVIFTEEIVEIHGSAPFWARLLFTKDKREELKVQIELLLHHTGLVARKPKNAKPAFAVKHSK
jgi:hypothetical protein